MLYHLENILSFPQSKETHVRSPQQGDVRHAEGSATLLPKNMKIIKGVWIRHQPIQSLRGKEMGGRRKTHSCLARRRHESVTKK